MPADAARPDLDALLAEAGWVRALAHSLVSDPAAADDVVQETWMAVLRRPPRTDLPVRPWLKRVVENFARMRRRGEAARASREERSARGEALISPDELVARFETQRLLAQEVLALEEPFRSTVVLRYYEGLSAAEIARRTDAPAGTVRWRLMRGLDMLRERLDQKHQGNRQTWVSLLVPLSADVLRRGALTSAGVGGAAAALRWVALLALLLIGAVWWRTASNSGEREPLARPAELASASTDDVRHGAVEPARAEVVGEAAPRDVDRALPASRIVARIVDRSRQPVGGARLQLVEDASSFAALDENGVASLALDPVVAERASPVAFEARADGWVARRVEARLAAGATTDLGEIELAPAGALDGFVRTLDGRPVAGARVRAEIAGSVRNWRGKDRARLEEARYVEALFADAPLVTTDASGRFRFDTLPESYVRLWVHADGYMAAWSGDLAVLGRATAHAPPFVLDVPPPEARIAGVVLDAAHNPVPFAELECARESVGAAFFRGERWVIAARADQLGRFDFGVTREWQRIVLAARDAERGTYARIGPIAPGERDVELVLATRPQVEIAIHDERGERIVGARVELVEVAHGRPLEIESASYALGFALLPNVEFVVRASAPGFAGVELGPYEPARTPATIDCTLLRTGALLCVVNDETGRPVPGARAELWSAGDEHGTRRALDSVASGEAFAVRIAGSARPLETATDDAGRCAFGVPRAGRWFARIAAEGFAPALIGPLELAPGRALEQRVELNQGGALAGSVARFDGRPIAGTVVGISCGDGWIATQRVGADGAYRFERLPPGRWQVREAAREAELLPWSHLTWTALSAPIDETTWDVDVRAGEVARWDLTLGVRGARALRGRLLLDGAAPGPWEVEAKLDATGRPLRATLDPFGRFQLELPRAGRWTLQLYANALPGTTVEVDDVLDVGETDVDWSQDLVTASLSLRCDRAANAASPEIARVRWRGPGSLEFVAEAELASGARVTVGRWPAGRSTVELDGAGEPQTIELTAGEARELLATRRE